MLIRPSSSCREKLEATGQPENEDHRQVLCFFFRYCGYYSYGLSKLGIANVSTAKSEACHLWQSVADVTRAPRSGFPQINEIMLWVPNLPLIRAASLAYVIMHRHTPVGCLRFPRLIHNYSLIITFSGYTDSWPE